MLGVLQRKFDNRQREWEADFQKELYKYSKEILMRGDEDNIGREEGLSVSQSGRTSVRSSVQRLKKVA
jgi:hypothetical protein